MVIFPDQGDIVSIKDINFRLLVVSTRFFNENGGIIACPIMKVATVSPLHIAIDSSDTTGIVICEQMKYFNLHQRSFHVTGRINLYQMMDISDAIQGIFEYI